MSDLERENKRLRAVVGELATVVDRMRKFVIATIGLENFTLLENNAELEKENEELRKKAEALDMLEEMNEVNLLRFGNKFFVSSYRMFSNVKQPYKASDDNLSTAIRAAYQAWKEVKE